ncbi:hypothetical protein CBR_g44544 [Chara braunii]|uniref:Uncharacterized protein n=1 Tax=Chara braunii TaxID=69332 RepID=A0A388LXN6_CHABU|nr:hypothetical protein CBR_g44544 [Chara braunii]|eukprot:GBG87088.1 hypothetical protein CBR_g44544 [Chara braunii]
MPRYTTSQTFTDGNTQIVALPDPVEEGTALQSKSVVDPEAEPLEVKLQRITEKVPVRVGNTSGSSAGSGSGDFHQYRQMRRKEQDRLARMEADYQLKKDAAEFEAGRKEVLKMQELRTAKRQKKESKKLAKTARQAEDAAGGRRHPIAEEQEYNTNDDDDNSGDVNDDESGNDVDDDDNNDIGNDDDDDKDGDDDDNDNDDEGDNDYDDDHAQHPALTQSAAIANDRMMMVVVITTGASSADDKILTMSVAQPP